MTVSITKSQLPPIDEWEECELVECMGTPEEHADKFYRYKNFGVEVHDDGLCQAYVIVDGDDGEEPIMVKEGLGSPEEAIDFLNEESNGKAVSEAGSSDEGADDEPEAAAEVEIEVVHQPEVGDDEDKDEKSEDKDMSDKKTESVAKMEQADASKEVEAPEDVKPPMEQAQTGKMECGSKKPMTEDAVAKAVETTTHSCTVQEAARGTSDGGLDDITHAGTVQEAEANGSSDGGLDDITHAKKVTLPAAQGVSMEGVSKTEPTFKSFSDMMAERESRKQRGYATGYTSYNEATIRKTACDNAQRISFGKGKDMNNIQDWEERGLGSIEGVSRKTSVSGITKSARPEGLMSFAEMTSIMKSGRYSAGTMDVDYSSFRKAMDYPPDDGEMGLDEGMGPEGDVPADGMPMAGGDASGAVLPVEGEGPVAGAEDMGAPVEGPLADANAETTGAMPGEAPAGDMLPPEVITDLQASASPVIQMIVSSVLQNKSQDNAPEEDGGEDLGALDDVGGMTDGLAGAGDMDTALGGSDTAGAAPTPVPDPTLATKEKPQLPEM